MERTLAIIKPDAVAGGHLGDILTRIEASGLKPRAVRMMRLTLAQANAFYAVHKERPFFNSLCDYIASGPVVVVALEGERAISRWRELMGATDPAKADPGTIRRDYGANIERNAAHGSDAPETAAFEVSFFFSALDLAA